MSTKNLLEPELQKLAEMPPWELTDEAIPEIREQLRGMFPIRDAAEHGVRRTEISVAGHGHDAPQVRCLLYEPVAANGAPRAAYLHLHGGGYLFGAPEQADSNRNLPLAGSLSIVVLSVAYRLSPEHSGPSALHDAYAGLSYLHRNAGRLGIDASRIGVGGESAGGGLAASLSVYARDLGEYPICFTALTVPMLDDRTTGSAADDVDPLVGEFTWTRANNKYAWAAYLGDAEPAAPQVPGRLEDYRGLPPCWMFTVSLDLFRDENIEYARNLNKAGVACELVVLPRANHGFGFVAEAPTTVRYREYWRSAIARGLSCAQPT